MFKGKKVGLFYGPDDTSEAKVVQSDLKRLHVDVVLSADDSVTATDAVAVDQEAQAIALRFKDAGVNEVVGVGGTRCGGLATGTSRQPEHVQAPVDRHERDGTRVLHSIRKRGESLTWTT